MDLIEHEARPILVVRLIEGIPLSQLHALGPVPAELLLRVGRQVCEGLAALHDAVDADGRGLGLLHRDVKPDNILVGVDGRARLIDLGIARSPTLNEATQTQTGVLKGTLRYLAPELFIGQPYSVGSDLWALGIALFEAALGRPVVTGSVAEVVGRIVLGTLLDLRPDEQLDRRLRGALTPLLATESSVRPQSASMAADLFRGVEASGSVAGPRLAALVRQAYEHEETGDAPASSNETRVEGDDSSVFKSLSDSPEFTAPNPPAQRHPPGADEVGPVDTVHSDFHDAQTAIDPELQRQLHSSDEISDTTAWVRPSVHTVEDRGVPRPISGVEAHDFTRREAQSSLASVDDSDLQTQPIRRTLPSLSETQRADLSAEDSGPLPGEPAESVTEPELPIVTKNEEED